MQNNVMIYEDSYLRLKDYFAKKINPILLFCLLFLTRKKTGDLPDVHLKQELKCAVKSALFRFYDADYRLSDIQTDKEL